MKFKTLAAGVAAAMMTVAPSVATAQTAERASPSVEQEENLRGPGLVIAILALAAIIAGIVIAVDDDDDTPASA